MIWGVNHQHLLENPDAVIQGGRVLEHGSHEALMQLGGHYAQLFALQARGYR